MIGIQTPTGLKAVASVSIRTPTGDKAVARIGIQTPTGPKDFFLSGGSSGMSVTASPISAIGTQFSNSSVVVNTNIITLAASGGTPPYSYAWSRQSGSTGLTATSPSSASTRFAVTLGANEVAEAVFRGTATDARGRTAFFDVSVAAYNYRPIGGPL